MFGNLPPAVIRNLSDDFQQLDRSNPQQDCWHIEIKPQSDRLLVEVCHNGSQQQGLLVKGASKIKSASIPLP